MLILYQGCLVFDVFFSVFVAFLVGVNSDFLCFLGTLYLI